MSRDDPIDAYFAFSSKRLLRRRQPMTDTSDTSETLDDLVLESPAPARARERLDAKAALAKAAFEASSSPQVRRRFKRAKCLAVVIEVPNATWVDPIGRHVDTLINAEKLGRDGSDRIKHLPTVGNDTVASALANGRSVVGISHLPERMLPSLLISSADVVVRVSPPTVKTIVSAMRLCLRGLIPQNLPGDLGSGLDFQELVAALRPHSPPFKAVERMQAAAQARSSAAGSSVTLPTLEEAIFYGEARHWGLALAADVALGKATGNFVHADRGAVFYGEPGTGKTWLAAMVARACGLPFIESSVADLFGSSAGYLDSVIKAQRAVFARAAALAPCVLLWDELDALPNRATMSSSRGRDFWQPVVDDFLMLVSSAPPGVIMIGATNYIEGVDKALLRPGRLERAIEVKAPETAEGLAMVLRFHLGSDLAGEDLVPMAHLGLGATAAVAMQWVRQARRTARTAGRQMIPADLADAIAPPDTRSPETLRRAAIHEAAHAVITIVMGAETVRFVTIVSNGEIGGRVKVGALDFGSCGRDHFEKMVISLLAARAAEIAFFGNATAGAGGHPGSDLAVATRLVASMHASLGLAGSLSYRGEPRALDELLTYDTKLRTAVEEELQQLQKRADDLVRVHRRRIEKVADALLAHRHLKGEEIERIMSGVEPLTAADGDATESVNTDTSSPTAGSGE